MIKSAEICNPKRRNNKGGFEGWFPYYAGYSLEFVSSFLKSSKLKPNDLILDPWNGSGTTTMAADELGLQAYGFDLNPVMVIAAKSCLVSRYDFNSLNPIAIKIVEIARKNSFHFYDRDPLSIWFKTPSIKALRNIEISIQSILFDSIEYKPLTIDENLQYLSAISSFYYVALFRTVRLLLNSFRVSNPTWIKVPKNGQTKKNPLPETVYSVFINEVREMTHLIRNEYIFSEHSNFIDIAIGDSTNLKVESNSINFIISSPPYCTRLDYAMAIMPELNVLGFNLDGTFDILRRKLIGTSTVVTSIPEVKKSWGSECNKFLDALYNHDSKASKTYYFKNHVQYFDSIFRSMKEIERTLKRNGTCALVVQDSYYKDIYNDVPLIVSEMGKELGLGLVREENFDSKRIMANINPKAKIYRTHITATETVLCFQK